MSKSIWYWFNNISIARKISLLLSLVFFSSVLLGGAALANVLRHSAQNTISGQAVRLIGTMNAIRSYTLSEVSPLLQETLSDQFIPAAIPAFSSRKVFEQLAADNYHFDGYSYKDAMLNPTSPKDKADDFETGLIEKWASMPDGMKEFTGYRNRSDGDTFYISRPIRVTDPSCLQCHSSPKKAPQSMLDLYGSKNGFNWPLNEVIGTQIVEVPVSQIEQEAHESFLMVMGIFILLFTVSTFALKSWLKQHIVRPIKQIARAAEEVSIGNLDVEFVQQSRDEIGLLSASFNRMKTSVALAMQRLKKYQNRQSP